ncbi:MAG: single-stranded DNA-binding protein [Streptosporangiaceae bacterium]|jgi:single-strand DNA-binding protein
MSQGGYVTLVGFVAQDPNIRTTATGKLVTKVRVGTTPRFRDSATGEWRDAETSYFNVSCWSRLADHVRASLHKGDPVIVKGRFRTSTFQDKNGQLRTAIEITADTVGHDLSRGPANYIRLRPQHVNTEDGPAGDEFTENPDLPEGSDGMIDEDAIERFGRDLDDAEVAARALEEDEAAETTEPPVPPVPAPPF